MTLPHLTSLTFDVTLQGVRASDVLVLHDADELPVPETLRFLKLHDGFPEPVGFWMRHR